MMHKHSYLSISSSVQFPLPVFALEQSKLDRGVWLFEKFKAALKPALHGINTTRMAISAAHTFSTTKNCGPLSAAWTDGRNGPRLPLRWPVAQTRGVRGSLAPGTVAKRAEAASCRRRVRYYIRRRVMARRHAGTAVTVTSTHMDINFSRTLKRSLR